MNMDVIKKQISNARPRRFGTVLSSNIIDNPIHQRIARKRSYKQLKGEQKEEEMDEARPTKKRRYNLRSLAKQQKEMDNKIISKLGNRMEHQKEIDSITVKGNIAKKGKKQQIQGTQQEVKMKGDLKGTVRAKEFKEQESDEDCDLAPPRTRSHSKREETMQDIQKQQERETGDKDQQPLRRSMRLKKKRERKSKEETALEPVMEPEPEAEPFEPVVCPKMLDCDEAKKKHDIFVPEYVHDIMEWYKKCEDAPFQRKLIKKDYISTRFQPDLNESMRTILLDWLFNVHRKFDCVDRSLYMATYMLDAYLSLVPVKRSQLQLIGVCALWVSAKYNEIYAPEATDFVYISDHSFEVEDLFSTEVAILVRLQFRFADIVTPIHFLERYLQIAAHPLFMKYKARKTAKALKEGQLYITLVTHLSQYFCHLALFDCKMVSTRKPSLIAAAALCFTVLSISLYSRWPEFLEIATGYSYKELRPTLVRLNNLREIAINETNGKMNTLRKMHKSVIKYLIRLNVEGTINNKN